jgi:hypothetical protein
MKIAFFGGSVSAGTGYLELKKSPEIYPNTFSAQGHSIVNHAIAGGNSQEIFANCCKFLATDWADVICIDWNTLIRFRFHPSPETEYIITPSEFSIPYNNHCYPFNKKDLAQFQKMLILTSHDYYRIIELIEYCLTLQELCKKLNTEIIMLNDSISWHSELFQNYKPTDNFAQKLNNADKEMLDFDNRPDAEIFELLNKLTLKFNQLDMKLWVNVFENFTKIQIDQASPTDGHPGPLTHKKIASKIINHMQQRKII